MRPMMMLLVLTGTLSAQNTSPESLAALPATPVRTYTPLKNSAIQRVTLLPTGFNDAVFDNKPLMDSIRAGVIMQIDFAYTQYASSDKFNQEKLNLQRFRQLYRVLPEAFNNPAVTWRLFEQTAALDADSAKNCFHGFVIVWRPPVSDAITMYEMSSLESVFGYDPKTGKACVGCKRAFIKGEKMTPTGKVPTYDTIWVRSEGPRKYNFGRDTVIFAVMKRNKQWKNMQIVCDVTGSMSPYTGQLLMWYYLNSKNASVNQFVFFNDGNTEPDMNKEIGNTGGIYMTQTGQFETVLRCMFQAMQSGNGGDTPENNLEAVSMVAHADTTAPIIMIADNWATPRDTAMMRTIGRPIHIILCGAQYGINTVYLDIARATGGSVHTMDQDLTDLAKLNEGEIVTIGTKKYVITNGKFVLLSSL